LPCRPGPALGQFLADRVGTFLAAPVIPVMASADERIGLAFMPKVEIRIRGPARTAFSLPSGHGFFRDSSR